MKLLILSDSHRNLYYAKKVIERIKDRVGMVIHLGDHDEDAMLLSNEFSEIDFHYIKGNCDYNSFTESEKIITIMGKKILMVHGHKHNVKWGYDRIIYYGQEKEADIILFGHTHIPLIYYFENILLLNPGSISQPRATNLPSFGIINIEKGGFIDPAIMTINERNSIDRLRIIWFFKKTIDE